MLTQDIQKHPIWEDLPLDKQDIFLRMAEVFESTDKNLTLDAEQLTQQTRVAHRHQWWEFLDLEPVQNYINQQQQRLTKVAARKTLQELQKELTNGNVGAGKEINQMASVFEKTDNNKIIILHRIPRPEDNAK